MTAKVRENIKYGADVIKFIATGGVLSEGDNPELAEYSLEEMKAIVETAHALGCKVAAHAHGALGIKYAVLAGVDSIEHGSYIGDEEIQLMKDHGTYLVPTVYLEDWLMENYKTLGFTTSMIETPKMVNRAHNEIKAAVLIDLLTVLLCESWVRFMSLPVLITASAPPESSRYSDAGLLYGDC